MAETDRRRLAAGALALVLGACSAAGPPPGPAAAGAAAAKGAGGDATAIEEVIRSYLHRYFETHPSRATAAGWRGLDDRLEDPAPAALERWIEINRATAAELERLAALPGASRDDRLDAELVARRAALEVFDLERARVAERDPLFWTGIAADAVVFLLVRDDRPLAERLASAAARVGELPRLVRQARAALGRADPATVAPEICALAARQAAAAARFYREGLAAAAPEAEGDLGRRLASAGREAAAALEELAAFLEELEARATGSPRLGDLYAERFRLATGVEEPVDEVLAAAEAALGAKRREAAAFGREAWGEIFGEAPMPEDDGRLLGRLFARLGDFGATSDEEFIADYRRLIDQSIARVRELDLITIPEPLEIVVDRSPAFFVGQSVGGVYPAGPWAPADAATLLFLPTPAAEAGVEERRAFYRDFNHHFNVMITPHEVVPGHALQLARAARHPRKVRAVFGDGVYIEGWGTFCERLMLDLGWGGPLDRLAHLKKQLENIARTVVDIRVHTKGAGRDEVLRFVREEALQEEQFAANMWRRSITSAPQLTFYWLGYREVFELYREAREQRGEGFELKGFMDGMMELGPVPVRHYRERLLGEPRAAAGRQPPEIRNVVRSRPVLPLLGS